MTDLLYKLIRRALRNGVHSIYIADPGRTPFLELAEKCMKNFDASLIETQMVAHKTQIPKASEKSILVIHQ